MLQIMRWIARGNR